MKQRHSNFPLLFILQVLFLSVLLFVGCNCEDEGDNEDDTNENPSDDDDNDDNDSSDDDDNDDNDDNNDNDDDDNDTDTGFYWKPDIYVQYIEGGIPGEDSTDIAVGPDDTMYVVADKGRTINLYTKTPTEKTWETETIAYLGYTPEIAVDTNGKLHICYMYVEQDVHIHGNLMYATNDKGKWQITTVDDLGVAGEYCSIALDDSDNAHISYFNYTNENLKYATNASGSWTTETAITGGVGMNTSIAIDSNGYAHVAMNTWPWSVGYVLYATNATGSWNAIVMSQNGGPPAVGVDPDDFIHIVYYGGFDDLIYQHNDSGSWEINTLDFYGTTGRYPSIAIDSDGFIHISYGIDGSPHSLKYATNRFGVWLKFQTSQTEEGGDWSSIALNSQNIPCISHHARLENNLKFTTFEQSTFLTETVDEGLLVDNSYLDIAIGEDNCPQISYRPTVSEMEQLSYAIRNEAIWSVEVVAYDSDSWFGLNNAISIDSDGFAHISYLAGSYPLGYATNQSGDWVVADLDSEIYTYYTFIETDNDDFLHMLYSDSDGVKYLTDVGGSWLEQIIDPLGLIAGSLVLNKNGNAFVTYYIEIIGPEEEVYFATNESGSWETVLLDAYGGDESSITLDSNSFSHIAYCDEDNGSLKYATNESSSWEITVLDSNGCRYPSIAIDSQDYAHVIWRNNGIYYSTNTGGTWTSVSGIIPGKSNRYEFAIDNNDLMHIIFTSLSGIWYARIPAGYPGSL